MVAILQGSISSIMWVLSLERSEVWSCVDCTISPTLLDACLSLE